MSSLAQVIEDCGTLGLTEHMLLDEIGRHLINKVSEMTAKDMLRLVMGYSGTEHSPSILLFQALSEGLKEKGGDLSPDDKKVADWGFEQLGYPDLQPFKSG